MRTRVKNETKGNRTKVSVVNLSGITVAAVLFGYAVSIVPPSVLAHDVSNSLAAASVSVSAGVPPNPINTLNEQLNQKAAQLDVQQKHIQDLQQTLSATASANDRLGLYSLFASALLLLLVLANFYFDWRRNHGKDDTLAKPLSVDLRALRQR